MVDMLLPKWKLNLIIWTLVNVLFLSSLCVVLFVVFPHIPNSNGRLSVIGQYPIETSFTLFVFGVLGTVALVIIICCLISWWIRARNKEGSCLIGDHGDTKSKLSYNSEQCVPEKRAPPFNKLTIHDKEKRNCVFEPYQNYGFEEEDEKSVVESQKGGVLPIKASNLLTSPGSSFAEDLYNSFKNIQLNPQFGQRQSFGRTFLESVDEEGYHFDNIEFSEDNEEEEEIEICSECKPPLQRLDTFDLKILDAAENLKNQIELNSQSKLKEEEEEVFKPRLERSVTQESFKGLSHLRAFNTNYLSLVHVDSVPSFLENESKDLFDTEFDKRENSFGLASVSTVNEDQDKLNESLTKKKSTERSSSESSFSSSIEGKNSSSELEWDATATDLISNDKTDYSKEVTRF